MAKIFIGNGKYYFWVGPTDRSSYCFDPDVFCKCFSFDSLDVAEGVRSYFLLLFKELNCSDYDFFGDDFIVSEIKEL